MFFIIVFLSYVSYGKTQVFVTESEAVTATSKYMQHYLDDTSFQAREVSRVDVLKKEGHVLLYEVCYKNGCSALVSGVKSVRPVLGYNINGDSVAFLQSDGKNGLSFFVGKFTLGIEKCISIKNDTILDEWNILLNDTLVHSRNRSIYGPLLTSQWKQSRSNDGQQNAYNYFVPSYCDNVNKCSAGCVPVAMAQIMNYWKYPVWRSDRAIQYDWCNMPDKLNYWENYPYVTNDNYETERDAIARLIADCGSASNVHYCIHNCESFAWPANAKNALVDSFGYHSSANLIRRIWHLQTWKNTIKSNIIAGRPVFYAAMDEVIHLEGHAFVCDGYDSGTDLFHFNWGWGGIGSWISIDSINSGSDDWTKLERAIVNLYPSGTQDYCNFNFPLVLHYHMYYTIYGNTTPAPYQNVPKTFTKLTSVPNSSQYPSSWRTIPAGATAEYVAHEEVLLEDGFEAMQGSNFQVYINPCYACENNKTTPIVSNLLEKEKKNYTNPEIANSVIQPIEETSFATENPTLSIYPNPTNGTFHIKLENTEEFITQVYINNMLGTEMFRKNNLQNDESINIATLPAGLYVVNVITNNGKIYFGKLAKQ